MNSSNNGRVGNNLSSESPTLQEYTINQQEPSHADSPDVNVTAWSFKRQYDVLVEGPSGMVFVLKGCFHGASLGALAFFVVCAAAVVAEWEREVPFKPGAHAAHFEHSIFSKDKPLRSTPLCPCCVIGAMSGPR
ncbi:hypothetical protein MRX96_037876 [Rhipicephalus microplus]